MALSLADAAVAEGDLGRRTLRFTVALSGPSTQTVRVRYQTTNGTAGGSADCGGLADYRFTGGTLTWLPGSTNLERAVAVAVCGDFAPEGDETLFVTLSNPVNALIADGQGTGTIADDD